MLHDKIAGKSHAGEGKRGVWHDKVAGKSHAGEEKSDMWHDKVAGKSHAGEGKEICGMTGAGTSTPEEGKSKCFRGARKRPHGYAVSAGRCRQ